MKPRPISQGWFERAVKGEPFVIAKAGKPLVKVTALDIPTARQVRRLGFMTGQIALPDDFDRMAAQRSRNSFPTIDKREAVLEHSDRGSSSNSPAH